MHDGPSMHGGLVEHFPFRNEHRFILEMSPFVLSLRRAMSSSLNAVVETRCNNGTRALLLLPRPPGSAPRGDPPPLGGSTGDAPLRLALLLMTTTMSRAR